MKKTRSILSALTVMAMLVSVPASVSAADSVSLIAGKATAKAGEEFSVDVKLSGIPSAGMSILDFAVGFDSSILTITDVTLGAVGNTGAIEADKDPSRCPHADAPAHRLGRSSLPLPPALHRRHTARQ